jgi:hypothetical protein
MKIYSILSLCLSLTQGTTTNMGIGFGAPNGSYSISTVDGQSFASCLSLCYSLDLCVYFDIRNSILISGTGFCGVHKNYLEGLDGNSNRSTIGLCNHLIVNAPDPVTGSGGGSLDFIQGSGS